jgi:hypothetical protein
VKPTFDEWFFARYGMTFEQMHMIPHYSQLSDIVSALVRETRDYVTEMVAEK